MSKVNPKLIADLARLAARYSPEDWRALSRLLQDDDSRALVAAMLDELAKASGRARQGSSTRAKTAVARPNTRDRLARLHQTDPESAELLSDLRTKLRTRELLADMASLRAFSEAVGMKTLSTGRREQAVSEIIQHLMNMPREALETALSRTTLKVDRELGREYEQWVSLILNRDKLS
jgi:hypothetical protein